MEQIDSTEKTFSTYNYIYMPAKKYKHEILVCVINTYYNIPKDNYPLLLMPQDIGVAKWHSTFSKK